MWRLFKTLGFIISWVLPFVVLYINHVVLVETTQELDMVGLIFAMVIVFSLIRYIDKRVEVWDIQNRNKIFIMSWQNGKRIIFSLVFIWITFTIEDDIVKIQWTAILISACFVVGFVFTLLGELLKRKAIKKATTI